MTAPLDAAAGAHRSRTPPTISVAMPAYQAERWIGETLESVLGQTDRADEIVVVDDGSTDNTAAVAGSFGDAVRVIAQANGGASAAYNRAFRESSSDYIAMCPADDLWEPCKIELQRRTLRERPDIDVTFGGARYFGIEERDFPAPTSTGVLDPRAFFREMYRADVVAAPTAVVRRRLFDELGGFREDLNCEDYEFWMRALKHGARFFHDPSPMVALRQHGSNLSAQAAAMWEMNLQIHREYSDALGDERLARETIAADLRTIGRARLGLGEVEAARRAYRASLGKTHHPAAFAWAALLAVPGSSASLKRLAARRRAAAAS